MSDSGEGRFVLEVEHDASDRREPEALTRRVRAAAVGMRGEGIDVRLLRFIYVPEERSCFLLLAAPDAAAAREALRRARIPVAAEAALTPTGGEERRSPLTR